MPGAGGTALVRHADMPTSFVYFHVELDDHSLVFTEGVPAEPLVDNVSRRRFDNWDEAPAAPKSTCPASSRRVSCRTPSAPS
ncbi:hypothetical protein [Ancylobacter defluvii]|uniref:hypothetical protein n=1 Tax=Ancylobacter defluvii TaxID=1282440 RepID=UPI001BCDC812|nr:hypothetical protein [Ancylobacter defluvii]MBS7589364.1 hypothetical protein [Ancylobacter defluvii]